MERATLAKTKIIILSIAAAIVVASGGLLAYAHYRMVQATVVTNAQHQLTQISYHGQAGVDALTLLKQKATVQVKHYSFGDLVTAINGSVGTGPKYWTFYVNGKQSQVGAGNYKTRDSDTLAWKLQQL